MAVTWCLCALLLLLLLVFFNFFFISSIIIIIINKAYLFITVINSHYRLCGSYSY